MVTWSEALVKTAKVSGFVGVPLWVISYAWLPAALTGHGPPAWNYLVIIGEVGALLTGTFALIVGLILRGRFEAGSSNCRSASLARMLGALLLFLVVIPNLIGGVLGLITAP
jgi:hypothetical protein